MNANESVMNLETFYNSDIKSPFTYDFNFDTKSVNDHESIFEQLKQIFIKGLLYITKPNNVIIDGEKRTVLVNKVSNKDIDTVKKYMLSMGIDVMHKEYTLEDKDYYIRGLLYDLQKNCKDCKLDVNMNWITQLIHNVNITIHPAHVDSATNIIKKHKEANFFLHLYKPFDISDYTISFLRENDNDILHIIHFKCANMSDYHFQHNRYFDQFTKYVR